MIQRMDDIKIGGKRELLTCSIMLSRTQFVNGYYGTAHIAAWFKTCCVPWSVTRIFAYNQIQSLSQISLYTSGQFFLNAFINPPDTLDKVLYHMHLRISTFLYIRGV
jgi:hypothetical protein